MESVGVILSSLDKLDTGTSISAALQLLTTLHELHSAGHHHGDVNADTVLLEIDDAGQLQVTLEALPADYGALPRRPHYMAPEQLREATADHRSDIWAVGVLLHEMLLGHRPFDGASDAETSHKILVDELALPEPSDDLPAPLVELIGTALEKDPSLRYQDASAPIGVLFLAHQRFPEQMLPEIAELIDDLSSVEIVDEETAGPPSLPVPPPAPGLAGLMQELDDAVDKARSGEDGFVPPPVPEQAPMEGRMTIPLRDLTEPEEEDKAAVEFELAADYEAKLSGAAESPLPALEPEAEPEPEPDLEAWVNEEPSADAAEETDSSLSASAPANAGATGGSSTSKTDDHAEASSATALPPPATTDRAPRKSRAPIVLALLFFAACAAAGAYLVFGLEPDAKAPPPSRAPRHDPPPVAADQTNEPSAVAPAEPAAVAPEGTDSSLSASAPEGTDSSLSADAATEPAALAGSSTSNDERVKITLPELPKKARVYVDGALVELPLRVPRSTDRIKIVVRAKGYHSHEDKVVPDRDRELEFKMWRRKR